MKKLIIGILTACMLLISACGGAADTRTLSQFAEAIEDAGFVLEDETTPMYQLIGASSGIKYDVDDHKVAIYQYKDANAAKAAVKEYAFMADWPVNGRFVLETSNADVAEVFNNI